MAFYMEKPRIIWAPSGKDVSNRLLLSHDTDLGGSYPAQPPTNLVFRLYLALEVYSAQHWTNHTIYFSGETGDRRILVSRLADSNWAVKEVEPELILGVQSTPFTMADKTPFYPGFCASGMLAHNEA